jgi:hypothetical protein
METGRCIGKSRVGGEWGSSRDEGRRKEDEGLGIGRR